MFTEKDKKRTARRLLRLADFLESLPKGRFDYGTWVGDDWKGSPKLKCGTTACAMGWAAAMPRFHRKGLTLSFEGEYEDGLPQDRPFKVNGARMDGEEAAALFFGLTPTEAAFLFMPGTAYGGKQGPSSAASAEKVARHIRRFVRDRDKLAKAEGEDDDYAEGENEPEEHDDDGDGED